MWRLDKENLLFKVFGNNFLWFNWLGIFLEVSRDNFYRIDRARILFGMSGDNVWGLKRPGLDSRVGNGEDGSWMPMDKFLALETKRVMLKS